MEGEVEVMGYLFCKIKIVQHYEGGSGEWTDRYSILSSFMNMFADPY